MQLRILILTSTFFGTGGMQTYSRQIARHFAERGDQVSVLAVEKVEPAKAIPEGWGVRVARFDSLDPKSIFQKAKQKIRLFRRLSAAVRSDETDIIFCVQWDPFAYICLTAKKLLGVRYIVAAHGQELVNIPTSGLKRKLKLAFQKVSFRGADHIFAVSNYTKQTLIDYLKIQPDRIAVFPNGVADIPLTNVSEQILESAKEKLGHTGRIVLLTVARLVPRKGHDKVIEAIPRLLPEFPSLLYVIVGEGPNRERLARMVDQGGLHDQVLFVGRVEDKQLPLYYQAADLFVMPCRAERQELDFEGFGISFLESYKYSKAVIAGRSGGVPDAVEDQVTGLLVDPLNVDKICAAIRDLLRDERKRKGLGQAGFAQLGKKYSWSTICGDMREVLVCLVKGARRASAQSKSPAPQRLTREHRE